MADTAAGPLIRHHACGAHRFESRTHCAPAAAATLLLLPALGVAARHYDALGVEMATRGVSLVVPDQRGIGSSSVRASRRVQWDYADVLDDYAALLATLHGAAPRAAIWLGGHSIGGQFATLLAARQPQGIAGLALVASGVPHWRHYGLRAAGMLAFAAHVRAACATVGYYPGRRLGFAGNESAALMREWTRTIVRGKYCLRGIDQAPALARLALPVLSVHLQHDWMIPPESARALVAMTAATTTEEFTLEDGAFEQARADHFGWMRDPAPMAAALAGFLLRQPPCSFPGDGVSGSHS